MDDLLTWITFKPKVLGVSLWFEADEIRDIYEREVTGKYREMNYKLWTIFRLEPHYFEVFSCRASLR